MPKRIVVFLLCFLLLITYSSPVFASGTGYHTETYAEHNKTAEWGALNLTASGVEACAHGNSVDVYQAHYGNTNCAGTYVLKGYIQGNWCSTGHWTVWGFTGTGTCVYNCVHAELDYANWDAIIQDAKNAVQNATDGNIPCVGHEAANNYTEYFNSMGGSCPYSSLTVTYDSMNCYLVSVPQRTGYTFNGWYTAVSGGTQVYDANGCCVNEGTYWWGNMWHYPGDLTLYAQWTPNQYNLTVCPQGGVLPGYGSATAYTLSPNLIYDNSNWYCVGASTRTGYTFKGYYNAPSGGTQVYAANGYCTNEGTYWLNNMYRYPGNLTLYAQWTPFTYTVSYKGNGSTSGSVNSSSHTYDTAKNLTENSFKKTGYTFAGWNTKADGTGTSYADKASVKNLTLTNGGTVTLYAQWTANSYAIKYNSNGGSGSMSDTSCTYDAATNLTNNSFTRRGYTFTGWNTKADGTGTSYADKASVKNLTSAGGETIMLYAQWELNPISVSIPRSLILNTAGDCTFVIQADNETGTITVNADDTVKLTQEGKNQVLTGTVSLEQNTLTSDRHRITGNIDAESLTAGSWSGVINLNITFKL